MYATTYYDIIHTSIPKETASNWCNSTISKKNVNYEIVKEEEFKNNKEYKVIGSNESQCTFIVNSNGQNISYHIIDKNVKYENKKVSIGKNMILVFSEDGKSFTLGDKTFKIEE